MNLYILSQGDNTGYDAYDSCVVAAENEDEARVITPDGYPWEEQHDAWAHSPASVKVELIGTATEGTEQGVIIASFNAG